MTSDQKMSMPWPPLHFYLEGCLFHTLSALLWNWKILFFCNIFNSLNQAYFFLGHKIKICQDNVLIYFCKNLLLVLTLDLQDLSYQMHIFYSYCKKNFIPYRPTVQKINGEELVTDRQTDIFELTLIHMENF